MSADVDKETACPNVDEKELISEVPVQDSKNDESGDKKKPSKRVCFPDEEKLVSQYVEPANPWHDVPPTSRAQLAAEYLEACRKHNTPPIQSVVEQIRELPETAIGGNTRAPKLLLSECDLLGTAPSDALEAILRKTQFNKIEIDTTLLDTEGAEALFDMIEYYESTAALSLNGPRQFGIRGWQAASRLIKKSAELSEFEVSESALEACHSPVLARALKTTTCRLRTLCLQNAELQGEPLLCLVIALKSNTSVQELRLGDNNLTPHDAMQLGNLLSINTHIHTLDLSNNQIQDKGVSHIADALERQASHTPPSAAASPLSPHQCPLMGGYESRGLACLMLWNNQLTRNCAPHLSKAVRCSQSLCVLNIGRNAIGTETIRALSAGTALLSLGLQAARLTPDAAPMLHQLVQETKAQRLDLRDNKLGAAGLQAILTAMKENSTLTQIDLDDPNESSTLLTEDNEAATVARLTREIRSLCRRNETATSPDRRVHRKISLTCHTTCIARVPSALEEERRGRLRSPLPSPAPSPAGSPVPAQHSRFSVTRVTPERELSSAGSSPSTPTHSPSPSRFRVVQVSEPPKIQVQPTTDTQKRNSSRFSVTRNYDAVYNVSPVSTSPVTISDNTTKTEVNTIEIKQESNRTVPLETNKNIVPVIIETTHLMNPSQKNADSGDSDNNKSDKLSDNNCNITVIKSSSDLSDKKEIIRDDMQLSHDEHVSFVGDDTVTKKEILLIKNSTEVSDNEKIDVNIKVEVRKETVNNVNTVPAKVHSDQNICINKEYVNIDEKTHSVNIQTDTKMKQIKAITEDLGHIIQEMKDLSSKTSVTKSKIKSDNFIVPVIRDSVVLKKNKSESSLDSPDLEVSRLMNKKLEGSAFCDSSSSLEISGSSMESLSTIDNHHKPIIIQESIESDSELDRRKSEHMLSAESSVESNETNPVNTNFLNMSVSSNESVSPIIFSKTKKIHGSISSLEASVSSVDSAKHERAMVTSSDSGIEHSLQNPSDIKLDNSSNEGTLTTNSSLKEIKSGEDTLTSSPKRTSSLLDMPALKNKGLDRMRKISCVAPSPSFLIQKAEEKIEPKLPSHLEKLLSLFHHPTSIFRTTTLDDEKKPATSVPPKKESITSSFWSWSSTTEKEEKVDENSSSENTDSTLSERIQVSYVDESFSKRLDSKTPSTDTDTLSEFQSPQGNSEVSDVDEKVVTEITTDDVVQKLDISDENASSIYIKHGASDSIDLIKPNDINKNDESKCDTETVVRIKPELQPEPVRPRSFAAVLKSSGSENTIEKQPSPEGQAIDKLPSKVIKGIKENISPENTLTSSMTNANTLALELVEPQIKHEPTVWEVTTQNPDIINSHFDPVMNAVRQTQDIICTQSQPDENASIPFIQKQSSSDLFWEPVPQNVIHCYMDVGTGKSEKAPLAVEEVCDDIKPIKDDVTENILPAENKKYDSIITELTAEVGSVDLGKDALSFLAYETKDFSNKQQNLAQELKEAELKMDHSPELVQDDDLANLPEVFAEAKSIVPERAKIKKSNSLEQLPQEEKKSPRVAFKESTTPRDIPDRNTKLRSRSGSSPKSLPESLYKPSPISKGEHSLFKKKKKVSSLGKIARDSLLALNLSEEEIAEFRRSYKLTSVESLRSLESVSEDANSQSGNSVDSRCKCLRTSQESLMSLDSINEDCRCNDVCGRSSSNR